VGRATSGQWFLDACPHTLLAGLMHWQHVTPFAGGRMWRGAGFSPSPPHISIPASLTRSRFDLCPPRSQNGPISGPPSPSILAPTRPPRLRPRRGRLAMLLAVGAQDIIGGRSSSVTAPSTPTLPAPVAVSSAPFPLRRHHA